MIFVKMFLLTVIFLGAYSYIKYVDTPSWVYKTFYGFHVDVFWGFINIALFVVFWGIVQGIIFGVDDDDS